MTDAFIRDFTADISAVSRLKEAIGFLFCILYKKNINLIWNHIDIFYYFSYN